MGGGQAVGEANGIVGRGEEDGVERFLEVHAGQFSLVITASITFTAVAAPAHALAKGSLDRTGLDWTGLTMLRVESRSGPVDANACECPLPPTKWLLLLYCGCGAP